MCGEEARPLLGDVGESVDGVQHGEQQRVGELLRQRRHALVKLLLVPLEQIQPGLAQNLARPGRDDG